MPRPIASRDPKRTAAKPKSKYKVRVGEHVQDGTVYSPGDTFESSSDLCARDVEKFELISGPGRTDPNSLKSGNQFPGGQVHDGMQKAGATDEPGPGGEFAQSGLDREATDESRQENAEGTRNAGRHGAKEAAKPATPTDEELHGMTVKELRDYADDNEIDLTGAAKKDEIIEAIKRG